MRDIGVYPVGAFRFATGLEPKVRRRGGVGGRVDVSTWVRARAGDVRFSFHVSMRTTKRQEMVFEGDGGWLVVGAPFNAGEYGPAHLHLRRADGADEIFRFPTALQYVNQVEAVAASVLDGAAYPMPLESSLGTQRVLDAVFDTLGRRVDYVRPNGGGAKCPGTMTTISTAACTANSRTRREGPPGLAASLHAADRLHAVDLADRADGPDVIQFIIMLVNNGEKNARLADFGTDLGIWMAKAARYQAAASNVKPWPWTDLD
jgi:hypothetical protein